MDDVVGIQEGEVVRRDGRRPDLGERDKLDAIEVVAAQDKSESRAIVGGMEGVRSGSEEREVSGVGGGDKDEQIWWSKR